MLNFRENLYVEEHSFQESFFESTGDILTSDQISGMEIRLSHVIVKDNKTPKIFPFPGLAKIYFVNLVLSDLAAEPISLDLKGFEKVDDGDGLAVDRTLFYWKKTPDSKKAPSQIHVLCSILKSKEDLREVGSVLDKIKKDNEYKDLASNLATLIGNA